ncbi:hypothetical protein [Streptomyces xiaopingdaonensis]|uniref:hypothetical protein n=1 Tax=Streptomyces xiaopingdaonensis TaxID=1565415 RepID=UPI000317A0A5|nr:hypothetical protein [Streptomyces xiaopingdaonensis]
MWAEHQGGFALDIPDDWEALLDPRPDTAMVVVAPEIVRFRPNLVVTVGPSAPPDDPAEWQRAAAEGLSEKLNDFHLIDAEPYGNGFRQLAAYVREKRALTLEQWAWQWTRDGSDTLDVTMSATVPTLAYDVCADVMRTVVESWTTVEEAT